MANYTMSAASSTVTTGVYESEGHIVRKHVIKFVDAVAVKGSALVQTDTIDAIKIYAGEFVVGAFVRIITAGTTSSTVQVGDQTSAASFIASLALDAASGTVSLSPGTLTTADNNIMVQDSGSAYAVTFTGGKYYASADTIRLTIDSATAPAAGVIEVGIVVIPVSASTTI